MARTETRVKAPDVWEALDQALDIGLVRPRLADGVEVVRFHTRWGSGYTMVKNPRGPSYFRFSAEDGEVLDMLDGSRTVRELVVDRLRESDALDLDVIELIQVLQEGDFFDERWVDTYALIQQRTAGKADKWMARVRNALKVQTVRFSKVHGPVDKLYRWGGWLLFTRLAQVVLLTILIGGTVLFYYDVHDKHFAISSKALATSFGLLFVLDLAATLIHELGHALAIRHAKRHVLSAGFQLYLGHPAFFIDSADIMLAQPGQRIRQAWFGPYSGFVIAGLCGGLVWFFPHSSLAQVLFNLSVLTYVTAAMNLIPFLELDGYWMLMDALQTTDLRPRSLSFLRNDFPYKLRQREALSRFEWALLGFGTVGAIFTVIALFTSYIFWKPVFGAFVSKMWHSGAWGQVLLIVIGIFILGPFVHGVIEFVRLVIRRGQWVVRRIQFRAELHWRREAGELISQIPLLDDIPIEALNELAGRVTLRPVRAGEVVVRQGDRANEFFVIRTGRVKVVDQVAGGEENVLRTMGPGEAFGELALLQSSARTATVRAEVDTELFVIDKGSFDRLLADNIKVPDFAPSMSELTEVWTMAPFKHLSSRDAKRVADAGEWITLPAHADIVSEGEVGDAFYIVGSGHLNVYEHGEHKRDLGPGSYFGEIALLLDVPRTATVQSRTPVRLFKLERDAFQSLVARGFRSGKVSVTAADRALPERT